MSSTDASQGPVRTEAENGGPVRLHSGFYLKRCKKTAPVEQGLSGQEFYAYLLEVRRLIKHHRAGCAPRGRLGGFRRRPQTHPLTGVSILDELVR